MKKAFLMSLILCTAALATAGTWTIVDAPGTFGITEFFGIDGDNIIGQVGGQSVLYDGTTWTTLTMPGATSMRVYDIDGDNIVGRYTDGDSIHSHGFLYDGTTWTTLNMPGADGTAAYAIDGDNIVGRVYGGDVGRSGFIYDGTTWTGLQMPGADYTELWGIDGDNIVGVADGQNFLYDGTTWTILEMPRSIYDILGHNIIGRTGDHSFLYDGTTWTPLVAPGSVLTMAKDIDGDKIVGTFLDECHQIHGFIYTIPEPATLLLLGLGGGLIRRRK